MAEQGLPGIATLTSAVLSEDRVYRYRLDRRWDEAGPAVVWVMLNPSTADEADDDPTVRRCCGFARAWGYGGITVVNAFAYRGTDPKELQRVSDPVGPGNDRTIAEVVAHAPMVVAAWGVLARPLQWRAPPLRRLLPAARTVCLGRTKDGFPRHPLYLPRDRQPEPFE